MSKSNSVLEALNMIRNKKMKLSQCSKTLLKDKDFLIICAEIMQQDFLQECGNGIVDESLEDSEFVFNIISCMKYDSLQDARLYTNLIKPNLVAYAKGIEKKNPQASKEVIKEITQQRFVEFVVFIEDWLEKRKTIEEVYGKEETTTEEMIDELVAQNIKVECKEYKIKEEDLNK